jgi:hypothetical protein
MGPASVLETVAAFSVEAGDAGEGVFAVCATAGTEIKEINKTL